MRKSILRALLMGVYLLIVTSFLLFAALEIPSLAARIAPGLPYYAIRREYQPDSVLIFRPAFEGAPHRINYQFKGDLYFDGFGVEVEPVDVDMVYYPGGFRVNSSSPPFDVAVIGDSYVELSESDQNTFSEYLRLESNLSIKNLGRSWYGPYQYVQVLKEYLEGSRFAVMMFYAGNDIADITEYERWQREGRYYGQDRRFWEGNFLHRYVIVVGQAATKLKQAVMLQLYLAKAKLAGEVVDYTDDPTYVRVGETAIPMVMGPLSPPATATDLLATPAWQSMRRLVSEFQRESHQRGAVPILVYVPTKMQSYAANVDETRAGVIGSEAVSQQRQYAAEESVALGRVAQELSFCFIDLLPRFQELASRGEILYHPFDTHWNEIGRRAAAAYVSEAMGWSGAAMGLPSELANCRSANEGVLEGP